MLNTFYKVIFYLWQMDKLNSLGTAVYKITPRCRWVCSSGGFIWREQEKRAQCLSSTPQYLSLNVELYGEKAATNLISDGTTILINVIQSRGFIVAKDTVWLPTRKGRPLETTVCLI